jgi:glycosyltransferase involved in cell wall biosynthesis
VQSFPVGYKDLFIPSSNFELNGFKKNLSISYINFPILKHFSVLFTLLFTFKYLFNLKQEIVFFAYGLSAPKLLFLYILKLFNKKIKVVIYIPDLPIFMSTNKNIFYKTAKIFDQKLIYFTLKKIEKFILVTNQMASKLNLKNNFIVVEGIYSNCHSIYTNIIKEKQPTIMYAGGIDEKYGVKHLINAFLEIKDKNFKLWLFGTGEHEKALK